MKVDIKTVRAWRENGNAVVLYCAGTHGRRLYHILKQCGIQADFFADQNPEKWGKAIEEDCLCLSPAALAAREDCLVFICAGMQHYEEIAASLRERGIGRLAEINDIMDDLIRNDPARYLNLLRSYDGMTDANLFYALSANRAAVLDSLTHAVPRPVPRRTAVYTSIFGDYDGLNEPLVQPPDMDYYFVSDVPPGPGSAFRWIDARRIIPREIVSPVKRNRYVKMHPRLLFPGYDQAVYLDGKVRVTGDLHPFVCRESRLGLSVFANAVEDCVYYEALLQAGAERVSKEDACRQMGRYLDEGMPLHYGLTEMSVLSVDLRNPLGLRLLENWWDEFDRSAQRDQFSFMYVLWKNGFGMRDLALLGEDAWKCDRIQYIEHPRLSMMVKNDAPRLP